MCTAIVKSIDGTVGVRVRSVWGLANLLHMMFEPGEAINGATVSEAAVRHVENVYFVPLCEVPPATEDVAAVPVTVPVGRH